MITPYYRLPCVLTCALALLLLVLFRPTMAETGCADFAGTASCVTDTDPGSTSSNYQPNVLIGNPINLITGNKFQSETDYRAYGSHLSLRRFYNSANADVNVGIGQGWQFSYQTILYKVNDTQLNIVQSNGRRIIFTRSDGGDSAQWVAAAVADGVIRSDGKYRYWQLADGRTLKFKGPFLVEINYSDGQYLVLRYKSRHLHSVTDQLGREITFLYTEGDAELTLYTDSVYTEVVGHLKGVRLPGGSEIYYDYDKYRNLVRVRYLDETIETYQYQNDDFKGHMTRAEQRTGERQSRWSYNANGQAIGAEINRGGTVQRVTASYSQIDDRHGYTDVTQHGAVQRFYWSVDHNSGHAVIDSVERIDCQNCAANKLNYIYSDADQLTGVDSSDGVDSAYRYDDQNRLIAERRQDRASGEVLQTIEFEYRDDARAPDKIIRRSGGSASVTEIGREFDENIEYRNGMVVAATVDGMKLTFSRRDENGYPTDFVLQGSGGVQGTKYSVQFDIEGIPKISGSEGNSQVDPNSTKRQKFERELAEIKLKKLIEELHRPALRKFEDPLTGIPLAPHCSQHYSYRCADLERGIRYGELAGCAYQSATCPLTWEIIQPQELGLEVSDFRNGSFRAELFYDPNRDEYVLTFVGTNDPLDWVDNIQQGVGITSPQYHDALDLSYLVQDALPGANINVAGHSLGGGLATTAALSMGTSAIVFNAAALTPSVAADNGLNYADAATAVTNYTVQGEILTSAQDEHFLGMHSAPGQRVPLQAPDHDWLASILGYNLLGWSDFEVSKTLHKMIAVLESLESEYDEIGCRRARVSRYEN